MGDVYLEITSKNGQEVLIEYVGESKWARRNVRPFLFDQSLELSHHLISRTMDLEAHSLDEDY